MGLGGAVEKTSGQRCVVLGSSPSSVPAGLSPVGQHCPEAG